LSVLFQSSERKHASEEKNALERNYRRQFDLLAQEFKDAVNAIVVESGSRINKLNNQIAVSASAFPIEVAIMVLLTNIPTGN
jgi:hypothetical protein